MMTLNCLKTGDKAEVVCVEGEKEVKERLRSLNVYSGARVRLLKIGFFGNSFLIEADGVRVGMRKKVAEGIFVRLVEAENFGEGEREI
jgi:Fe2+ transport system protein FeoA